MPLALDQAGAYIEETHCRLSSYLDQYRSRQVSLLQRRGGTGKDHPEPVATTWALSFEQAEQCARWQQACYGAVPFWPPMPFLSGSSSMGLRTGSTCTTRRRGCLTAG